MPTLNVLINRFSTQQATIGIVGLDYIGLPLMLCYSWVGSRVLGIDIDFANFSMVCEEVSQQINVPGTYYDIQAIT